ncbi:hypothetical protein HK104_000263 [Borealophlyctis nickersoniae]|nr:hypothetical protein HK104_000263 [Borealophlyctis nickersoniae]
MPAPAAPILLAGGILAGGAYYLHRRNSSSSLQSPDSKNDLKAYPVSYKHHHETAPHYGAEQSSEPFAFVPHPDEYMDDLMWAAL